MSGEISVISVRFAKLYIVGMTCSDAHWAKLEACRCRDFINRRWYPRWNGNSIVTPQTFELKKLRNITRITKATKFVKISMPEFDEAPQRFRLVACAANW